MNKKTGFHDVPYLNLVIDIMFDGHKKTSRGGAISSTRELFGPQIEFDLREGFPLLTTKKMNLDNVYHELCWFLRGETNTKTLKAPKLW